MSTRPRISGIYEFLCEPWYVQYSLNRGNILLKWKQWTSWEPHEYRCKDFNTLGGIFGENLLNKSLPFSNDFNSVCIQLRKYFIANLFAKVSISVARRCHSWYVRPYRARCVVHRELLTTISRLLFQEVDCCVIHEVGLQGLFSFVATPVKKHGSW